MQLAVAGSRHQTGARRLSGIAPILTVGRPGPNRRQAARTAEVLGRIVDRDLELVRAMPAARRARQVDRLAAIVRLAQAYRHFANGWIGRRELRRRLRARTAELVASLAADPPPTGIRRIAVIRPAERPR